MKRNWLKLVLIITAALAVNACGSGTGVVLNERAADFAGGALSSFGGADSEDTTARATARDIMVGREFDCISSSFLVAAGTAITDVAAASSRFSGGMGDLAVDGDEGVLTLEVFNVDPEVVYITITGYFSVTEAQRAVEDAGASFLVDWEIEFTEGDVDYSLTAQQVLAGTNWTSI